MQSKALEQNSMQVLDVIVVHSDLHGMGQLGEGDQGIEAAVQQKNSLTTGKKLKIN
jgi:hypothetical protein